MKKVLITGGAGFIGLHLATYFLEKEYHVDIIDNFSRGVNDFFLENLKKNKNFNLYNIDLMNSEKLNSLSSDYTYIFHLAAIIGVANVIKQPYVVLKNNILLLLSMLEFCKKQKKLKRFLFASTSEVYAGTLESFKMEIPTPETTPLTITDLEAPRTSYMLSKIYGEALCNMTDVPITIFRPHNIYGPRMGMAHVIPELLKKCYFNENNKGLEVFSVFHKRTFCYIDDAVELLFLAATSDLTIAQTINLGNQAPEVTMEEVGKIILQVTGKNMPIIPMPATAGSPLRRCPNMQKTTEILDYQAKVDLHEGIQKTFDWYRKYIFDNIK